MPPRRLDPDDLASVLPPGGRVLVRACSGELLLLAEAVARAGETLGAMTFTGIFVPGLNTRTYLANPIVPRRDVLPDAGAEGGGRGDEVSAASATAIFCDGCAPSPIDAALFMATPPDAAGNCSFGPVVDFLAELWPRIPVRIAHINPRLPRVASPCRIPFEALTAYVEGEQDLLGIADRADDAVSQAIGEARRAIRAGRRDDPDGPRQDLRPRRCARSQAARA